MVQLRVASMFFFSGLAVVIALVVVVYGVAWVYDRASGAADAAMTPLELEEQRVASTLVKDAGLASLLPDEKNQVMRHFFENSSKAYVKQSSVDDIEAPRTTTQSKETGSGQASNGTKNQTKSSTNSLLKPKTPSKNENAGKIRDQSIANKTTYDIESNYTDKDKQKSQSVSEPHNTTSCCNDPKCQETLKGNKSKRDTRNDDTPEMPGVEEEMEPSSSTHKEFEEGLCPICLVEFENDDNILMGNTCGHMFHFECFLQWVEKSHTDCPLCRSEMINAQDFLETAYTVLGEQRVNKLKHINEEAARRLADWESGYHPEEDDEQEIIEESIEDERSSEPVDPPARMAPLATDDTSRLTIVMVQ